MNKVIISGNTSQEIEMTQEEILQHEQEQLELKNQQALQEVDVYVSQELRKQYDINQEFKILREALASMNCADAKFVEYNSFVESKKAIADQRRVELEAR